jgi:hypothetical protein
MGFLVPAEAGLRELAANGVAHRKTAGKMPALPLKTH